MTIDITQSENGGAEDDTRHDEDANESKQSEQGRLKDFKISKHTRKLLKKQGFTHLFPVQVACYRQILEGQNVIVKSQTGSGKTLAFMLPLAERIAANPDELKEAQVLVLSPTRELVIQTSEYAAKVSEQMQAVSIYGGAPIQKQIKQLRSKPTFLVCTPGRLLDLIENHNESVANVRYVVLDECDRMLDMGFLPDVDKILSYVYTAEKSSTIQTLVFSATVPESIRQSINKYIGTSKCELVDMLKDSNVQTAENVEHLAMEIEKGQQAKVIARVLQVYCGNQKQAIVFCGTKRQADELSTSSELTLSCHVLHGDIPQDKREMVMKGFRKGKYRVLVTTDVASRGLDIPEVDLVVTCQPPQDSVNYIHRSGRTGRAGRTGVCICLYHRYEARLLKNVEEEAGIKFKKVRPPTVEKSVNALAGDAISSLAQVSQEAKESFYTAAEALLESMEAKEALSAALAVMCKCEKKAPCGKVSSLTGSEKHSVYVMTVARNFRGCGLLMKILRDCIGDVIDTPNVIGKILFTEDTKSCYFELDKQYDEQLQSSWADDDRTQLSLAEEIPDNLITASELWEMLNGGSEQGSSQRNQQNGARGGQNRFQQNGRNNGGFKRPNGNRRFGDNSKRPRSDNWQQQPKNNVVSLED